MQTHTYELPDLHMINQTISEKTAFDNERSIIDTFYSAVRRWEEQQAENTADAMGKLNVLWRHYVINLPPSEKERAKKLVYLVTYQTQTLPQNFTYSDVLSAVFLIMLPDLLAQRHLDVSLRGQRDDDLFGMIRYVKNENGSYELIADNTANPQIFETFVSQNEITLGERSIFKKFEHYLTSHPHLDRYSQQDFSLMLLDEVVPMINQLLENPAIKQAIDMELLDIGNYINLLHDIMGWGLATYLQEKQGPIQTIAAEAGESQEDNHELMPFDEAAICRNFQERTLQTSARSTCRNHHALTHPLITPYSNSDSTIANAITFYIQRVRLNISIGITSAFTDIENALEEVNYPMQHQSRSTLINSDIFNHAAARMQLGLTENESYERFICAPYRFPDNAFLFSKPIEDLSEQEILDHFFIASMSCLRKINKNRCHPIIFEFIIQRLWHAFIHDARCGEALSQRLNTINLMTQDPNLTTIIDFFNANSLERDIFLRFYTLLENAAQNHPTLLLIIAKAVLAHSQIQPNAEITQQEEYIILHFLGKIEVATSNSLALQTISTLLNCTALSARNRFCLVGVVAEKTCRGNLQNLTALLDETKEIDDIVLSAIGEDVAEKITLTMSEIRLHVLMNWYETARCQNHHVPVLTQHIENHCSRGQLETLKVYLGPFSTLRKTSQMFSKLMRSETIETVINKINSNQPAAEVLLSLKKVSHSHNEKLRTLFDALNRFFNNGADMSELLTKIQSAWPSNTSFALSERRQSCDF